MNEIVITFKNTSSMKHVDKNYNNNQQKKKQKK